MINGFVVLTFHTSKCNQDMKTILGNLFCRILFLMSEEVVELYFYVLNQITYLSHRKGKSFEEMSIN